MEHSPILVARPMLLRSRILVAKCQLAAASGHGAVARLPAVSRFTHNHTANSLASGSTNNRCKHNRAKARAELKKDFKASASSVVAPAIKPRSVN